MAGPTKREKDRFSVAGLRVAKAYVVPRRWKLLRYGSMALAVVVAYFAIDHFFFHSRFISGGPLASAHAGVENDCARCHMPSKWAAGGSVTDAKCSTCHEKTGDALGVYSAAAHAVYRSGDPGRAAGVSVNHAHDLQRCADCHSEHRGRDAQITRTSDRDCVECHKYESFNRAHPEFQFARDSLADESTLIFTHRHHTQLVMAKIKEPNVEQACLYCHVPESDGKHFRPLDFDLHCAECHLNGTEKTGLLAVLDPSDPGRPGVETLEMIRMRGGPGTVWVNYASPGEFTRRGDKILKKPVYHEDPWILENLRRIRRQLYPDAGLADLLKQGGSPTASAKRLYEEALRTLDAYALGLRGRAEPEIVAELKYVDSLLAVARARVRATPAALRDPGFALSARGRSRSLGAEQRDAIDTFVGQLTERCMLCHVVRDATIQRVIPDQRTFVRAEFDHRAHIEDRRCLDCHNAIPITDEMLGGRPFVPEMDRASIQNLPRISNCRECHNPAESSNRCATCHLYHSNKMERANLLLFKAPL